MAKFSVIGDLRSILESSYSYIITEELGKVSELTNRIFLEMIGADAKQSAIIQRAEITQDFDIIVHGPSGKLLDPDNEPERGIAASLDTGLHSGAHQSQRSGGAQRH